MPRKLLALNVLLGAVSAACIAFVAQQLVLAPPAAAPARPHQPGPSGEGAGPAPDVRRPPASAYNVVATRSIFSPTRTETATLGPGAGGPGVAAVKPHMHGVVLRDTNPLAYLEDPVTKRVAGYRIGDSIAGGTLKTIASDRVVIARPDGEMDVRLRDPSKPRPALPVPAAQPAGAAAPVVPGAAPASAAQTPPSIFPPGLGPALVPPRVAPAQVQTPPTPPAVGPSVPGRRPVPSVGQRFPIPPIGNAQPRQ